MTAHAIEMVTGTTESVTPLLRNATAADMQAIRELLESNSLPASDLPSPNVQFTVACEGARIVAAGALERFGRIALLRSVAVESTHTGRGLGRRIVKALENQARAAGISQLVLLTQTARTFFEHQAYRLLDREQVPKAVQASAQFRTLCPASADCMMKILR